MRNCLHRAVPEATGRSSCRLADLPASGFVDAAGAAVAVQQSVQSSESAEEPKRRAAEHPPFRLQEPPHQEDVVRVREQRPAPQPLGKLAPHSLGSLPLQSGRLAPHSLGSLLLHSDVSPDPPTGSPCSAPRRPARQREDPVDQNFGQVGQQLLPALVAKQRPKPVLHSRVGNCSRLRRSAPEAAPSVASHELQRRLPTDQKVAGLLALVQLALPVEGDLLL